MDSPLFLLLIIFAVMMLPMLWMSSRQRKMQRERQAVVNALGVGDQVRTHSGFYGLIVEADDEIVILETESGAQTKWARAAIAMQVDADGADAVPSSREDEDLETSEDDFRDLDGADDRSTSSSSSDGDIFGTPRSNDR